MKSIHIRALSELDTKFLKYLDSQVKWGFGQKIPEIFLEFSNSAYLAEDPVTQEPYGMVITYFYPPSTGWIGFLIVDEIHRRKGIGGFLFSKAVDHLLEIGCREILLDAVPNVISLYEKFHFLKIERSLRLKVQFPTLTNEIISSPQSILIQNQHLRDIGEFDLLIFGAKRNRIFQIMLKNPKSDGAVFIQDNMIKGYGFIRYSENSFSIGPLIANNPNIALDIISKLVQIGTPYCKNCEWILLGITETSR
ncbi:MAG: GNAT family N-acetyltransferase, partial [Promethearchaeota archaeon]